MDHPFTSPDASRPPPRPARSLHRLSAHSSITVLSTVSEDAPPLPSAPATPCTLSSPSAASSASSPFSDPQSPRTPESHSPTYPSRTYPSIGRQKSAGSIRRKPVPLDIPDLQHDLDAHPLPTPSTISRAPWTPSTPRTPRTPSDPPSYILPVDPPSYPSPLAIRPSHHDIRVDVGVSVHVRSVEELPRYAEEEETEPRTLARSLWVWGWLCPLLWGLGMCILWIPLKPVEEEQDAEKAQKLEEMIVILREVELKYARRCLFAFITFLGLVVAAITLGIVLPKVL